MSKKPNLKNPLTGKKIKLGGPTHTELIEKGILNKLGEEKTKYTNKDEVVHFYIDYSVTKDGIKYQIVNLPERADQIVSSNISNENKVKKMMKMFLDFRYRSAAVKEKVDGYFNKIGVSDITDKFVEAQKQYINLNLRKGRKEILSIFSSYRFRESDHNKYIIIESILKTPKKKIKIYMDNKAKTNFDLIYDSATIINTTYEDFNDKIPLSGNYVLKDDFEILELAIKHNEVMFLQFLVAANINIIKKKDSGLYSRLVKYIDDNLDREFKSKMGVFISIFKASDLGKMEIDGVFAFLEIKRVLKWKYDDEYDESNEIQYYIRNIKEGENYINLLEKMKISYNPEKDSITGFFQRIKPYVKSSVRVYPYILSFGKKRGDLRGHYVDKHGIPEMLVPDDDKRKLLLDQIVDYYVKTMNMDSFAATQHLQEDIEEYFSQKMAFEFDVILNYSVPDYIVPNYSLKDIEKTKLFIAKIEKDIKYLETKAKILEKIMPGGLEYLKVMKSFQKRQKRG